MTKAPPPQVPAARYLRISTAKQQFSLENQAAAIADYAAAHNFSIVASYEDGARSGVVLRRRTGLQALLRDVMSGPLFKVILVYDVSRWGRFQDVDEAGHYEFLCRSAGVPIHYCAEQFPTGSTIGTAILKQVKRTMAAAYSRELGDRTLRGETRLVGMGYTMGGVTPYGFRRLLVNSEDKPKQLLQPGERKSIISDHVRYCLGPERETDTVRLIFRLALDKKLRTGEIVDYLNAQGLTYKNGAQWKVRNVGVLLRNVKYTGTYVWRKRTSRLHTLQKRTPKTEWVTCPHALPQIVDQNTFTAVQELRNRASGWTDKELLAGLKEVWRWMGEVTEETLSSVHYGATYKNCVRRFGSLENALKLIGYRPRLGIAVPRHRRSLLLCEQHRRFLKSIRSLFPKRVEIIGQARSTKELLLLDGRHRIAVILCSRWLRTHRAMTWRANPGKQDRSLWTLCCLLDREGSNIVEMYFMKGMPSIPISHGFIQKNSEILNHAVRLRRVKDFCRVASRLFEVQA